MRHALHTMIVAALLSMGCGGMQWSRTARSYGDGTVTFGGSVLHSTPGGCGSHFFVTCNQVRWC